MGITPFQSLYPNLRYGEQEGEWFTVPGREVRASVGAGVHLPAARRNADDAWFGEQICLYEYGYG
ncbi:MAG TPA: hypothetical protein VI451_10720 [Anaerolineales bacterium]|nr:hypothetical protein [Anaerolineales bacterium]